MLPGLVLALGFTAAPSARCPSPRLTRAAFPPRAAEPDVPSALEQRQASSTSSTPSISFLGATSLVAGTTVGAGIIALPAKTLAAGFMPSTATLVLGWLYMASTGLLIAEVNVNTLCALERDAVSMSSMAQETLGPAGARASSLAFLFLHYALLTAYIIQGGALLLEAAAKAPLPLPASPPTALGPPLFALILGGAIVALPPRALEGLNNALVLGVVLSFVALLGFGAPHVDVELLSHVDLGATRDALPLMPVVYVYQTVVPSLCYLLDCDLPRIRAAILAGSAVPLAMFVVWTAVILGTVPYDAAAADGAVVDPLESLRSAGDAFGETVLAFSLLAVSTSFLGFTYGLIDFMRDALGWEDASGADAEEADDGAAAAAAGSAAPSAGAAARNVALLAAAVLPPIGVALWDPSIFFTALDYGGVYGILVLFGLIPAAMAWAQRYGPDAEPAAPESLPGGRSSLAAVIGVAASIIGLQTWETIAAV